MKEKKEGLYIKFIRMYCWLERKKFKLIARLFYKVNRIVFSNDIPSTVQFGKKLTLPHFGLGIVLHPRTIIGDNCTIYQNVTLGCRKGEGPPIIKNNCLIGAGACVLGKITLENNCSVGANAVVTKDVKEGSTVVGIPAYEIARKEKE